MGSVVKLIHTRWGGGNVNGVIFLHIMTILVENDEGLNPLGVCVYI